MLRRHFMTKAGYKPNVFITYRSMIHIPFCGGYAKKGNDINGNKIQVIFDDWGNDTGRWGLYIENKKILSDIYILEDNGINTNGYPNNVTVTMNSSQFPSTIIDMEAIIIGEGVEELINSFIDPNYANLVESFILPKTLIKLYGHFLYKAFPKIKSIIIPENVTHVGNICVINNHQINNNELNEIILLPHIPPITRYGSEYPPLSDDLIIEDVNPDLKIKVLPTSLDLYKTAEDWKLYYDFYIPMNHIKHKDGTIYNKPLLSYIHTDTYTYEVYNENTFRGAHDCSYIEIFFDIINNKDYYIYINNNNTVKINIKKLINTNINTHLLYNCDNIIIGCSTEMLCCSLSYNNLVNNIKIEENNNLTLWYRLLNNIIIHKDNFINESKYNELAANYWGAKVCDKIQDNYYIRGTEAIKYIGNEKIITIPNYITSVDSVCYDNMDIETLIIPGNIKTVSFFVVNPKIKNIILEEGVEVIQNGSLSQTKITNISIPNSIKQINNWSLPTSIINDNTINGVCYIDNCLIKVSSDISGEFIIKDGTRLIANNTFENATNITNIIIPDSVKYINAGAFNNLNIDTFEANGVLEINRSFINCNIKHFIFKNATIINDSSFKNSNILTIDAPKLEYIYDYAFENSTIQNIDLSNIIYIGKYVFNNSSLNDITLGDTITYIGERAFYSTPFYNNLTPIDGIYYIGTNAIGNVTMDYNSSAIKDDTTLIAEKVFYNCTSSIIFPNTLKYICDRAFKEAWMSNGELNIPASVIYIGKGSFQTLFNNSITVDENNEIYDSRNNCNAIIETATNKLIAGCESTIIPDSVVEIEASCYYSTNIGDLHISKNLTNIKIDNIIKPKSIIIDDSNPVYSNYGYNNVIVEKKLDKLILTLNDIPNNIAIIGQYSCCNINIENIILPDTLLIIEDYAFHKSSITTITIPKSVISIGNYVFYSDTIQNIIINYTGTKELWDCIYKSYYWKRGITGIIHCIDGDIEL